MPSGRHSPPPKNSSAGSPPQPVPVSVDYHLEFKGGKTILRLVHSGFGNGKTWDHEFDGVSRGWAFELRGLRHYLENHAGQDRRVAWVRKSVTGSPAAIMPNVIGPKGRAFRGELADLREGDPYRLENPGANLSLQGKVAVNTPPRAFAGTVAALNNGFMRVEMENCAGDEQIWA
ncbi:MAG: SRPBCC domain-containing protein [Planctomycetes bacterium]|nr:SRPBCC domain-containing protein [Planctomycetota bacterium]